jgi:hypothetical protein
MTDWIHGELWLCPDGLLRRALGFLATVRHGSGPTVDATNRPSRTFGPAEIESILASNRRNMWIPRDEVLAARLDVGPLPQVTLTLDLRGGRTQKLLWLPSDQVPQELLDEWIRPRRGQSE